MRRIISAVTAKKKALIMWNIIYKEIKKEKIDYAIYDDIRDIKIYALYQMKVNKKLTSRQYKLIADRSYCTLCAYFSSYNGNNYARLGECKDDRYVCPLLHCVGDRSVYHTLATSLGKNKENDLRRIKEIINAIESWEVSK